MKTGIRQSKYKFAKGPGIIVVLSLLNQQPMHGYKIVRRLCRSRAGLLDVLCMGEGTIYPLLHRLRRRGFIRGKWVKSVGRRLLHCYVITPKGRKELALLKSSWMELTSAVQQIVVRGVDGGKNREVA